MKVAGITLALVLGGALLYWFLLRTEPIPAAGTTSPIAAGSDSSSAPAPTPAAAKTKIVDKVRRITKEERAELAGQIQQAKTRRDNLEGRDNKKPEPMPTLPDNDVTIVKTTMKAAMQELVPMLSDCYDRGGSALPKMMDVVADLQLTGDPDVGTIVDANSLVNKDGTPIDPKFEACVRDTLVTLEMPPLSEGGAVKVTYPFAFARDDSTMPQ